MKLVDSELTKLDVIIVDDDLGDRALLKRLINRSNSSSSIVEAQSIEDAMSTEVHDVDVIFLDNVFPARSGLGAISSFRTRWPRAAIFFMTGQGDEEIAKSAIKSGATDYIPKSAINANAMDRLLTNGVRAAREDWKLVEQRNDLRIFSEVLIHDLKAPIRAAAQLSEQIEEDYSDGDLDGVLEGVRLLRKSSTQMMEMIVSLSDHVRFDREIEAGPFAPGDLIDRALTAVGIDVTDSGARVSIDVDDACEVVHCNAPQIAQVIQNLVANAIKFSGSKAPDIRITVTLSERNEAVFEVRDQGIGISEEFRERVFEPFKRVPGNTGVQGTGLGLATCRKNILRHGGRIWCDALDGPGTIFKFSLPANGQVS